MIVNRINTACSLGAYEESREKRYQNALGKWNSALNTYNNAGCCITGATRARVNPRPVGRVIPRKNTREYGDLDAAPYVGVYDREYVSFEEIFRRARANARCHDNMPKPY
jgi:hypothetical protein